jgi:hypothetical protein
MKKEERKKQKEDEEEKKKDPHSLEMLFQSMFDDL